MNPALAGLTDGMPGRPAAVAGGAAVIPDRRWDSLTISLSAYVLTAVGRVHQLFSFLEPLHLPLLSAGLAVALYMTQHARVRRLDLVLRQRTTRCVVGLLVWMALSIPGALWPGGALVELTDEFGKAALMYVVLASAVRGLLDLERLTFAYLISVGVYSAVVLSRFSIGGDQWRLASLYYYDANEFATLGVVCLPLAVYFVVRPRPLWRRLASAAAGVLITVGFVWAGSRGGFIALLAVGGFLLVRYRAIRVGWRLFAAALLVLVFAATATDTYWQKMGTILSPKEDYNVTGQEGRLQLWKRGMGYMLRNPVFGVGAGNFPTAEGTISPLLRSTPSGRGVKWSVAHNSYVQVGAELGIPGLLLFLILLRSAFGALSTIGRGNPSLASDERGPPAGQLAEALAASLVGYVVGAFFLSLAYRDLLMVLIGLIAGLRKVTGPPPRPIPRLAVSRAMPWRS